MPDTQHIIIVHAFRPDTNEYLEHHDVPVPVGTPVAWTAYERHMIDGEDQPDTWDFEEGTFKEVIDAAYAKSMELGNIEIRVEHEPDEIFK